MVSIQEKVTDAILATIRSRRNNRERNPPVANPVAPRSRAAVSLRQAEFSDFRRVSQLGQRLGQGADSEENWKRLWRDNPAVQSGRAVPRIGWVLETGGAIVGFFGTIPMLCEFQGTTLVAAASCRFVVDPEFRSYSHLLVASFLRQKDVDLLLNTTATPAAGKMLAASKADPVPQEDYGRVLFWVLDCRRFVECLLRKLEARPSLATAGSWTGWFALWGEMRLRGRIPQPTNPGYRVSEYGLDKLPVELDGFCAEQLHNSKRLLGKRNSAILRWHFASSGNRKVCRVLVCRDEKCIQGYAVTRQELDHASGLRRSIVADLFVAGDNPTVVQALIGATFTSAKVSGSHVIEIMGFPRSIRETLLKWKPYTRDYPSCPYFYKARDRGLHEILLNADRWYACPFDGDATLWP